MRVAQRRICGRRYPAGEWDGKLFIAEVQAKSPAAETSPPLRQGDLLATIDRKSTDNLLPDTALALLQGEVGTEVELGIHTPLGPRTVTLRRRPLFVPSVNYSLLKPGAIGYVEIYLVPGDHSSGD